MVVYLDCTNLRYSLWYSFLFINCIKKKKNFVQDDSEMAFLKEKES